jgi:hypothetical protein
MMLALPYANISNLLGIEDGLVYLLYPLCLALFVVANLQNFNTKVPADGIALIIYITLGASIFSYLTGYIETQQVVDSFFKFALFILLFDLVKSHGHRSANFILKNYSNVFFWSLILSLFVYAFIKKPEFIFYDGSASRFGGFHFELFNFCFSSALCCASLIYKDINKAIIFCILCFLMYVSKSNFSFIYILVYLVSFHTNILSSLYLRRLATMAVLTAPVFIGLLLDELSFLSVLSVRESTSFDHSGSSVFARLYPYSLAYSQLISDGVFSLLPGGFGYLESTDLVKNDINSFGGTGSPKELVNLGVILFSVLIFIMLKKIPKVVPQELRLVNFIWFSTISFISFGSGFFNLFAWIILASLFNWRKTHV